MAAIKINGKEYPVPDSFTMGELADMEEITGQGYDMAKRGVKGMLAIAFIAARRKDPSVTVDDIRQLSMDQIEAVGDDADEVVELPTESDASSGSSSVASSNGSDRHLDETPERIGVPV